MKEIKYKTQVTDSSLAKDSLPIPLIPFIPLLSPNSMRGFLKEMDISIERGRSTVNVV